MHWSSYFANFVEAKRMEWAAFRQTVSEWERTIFGVVLKAVTFNNLNV